MTKIRLLDQSNKMTCIKNTKLADKIDSKELAIWKIKTVIFAIYDISVILVELTDVSVPDMIDFKLVTC